MGQAAGKRLAWAVHPGRPVGLGQLSPVAAGLCPEQAGQDQLLSRVAHLHQLLGWHLGEDVGGLQQVPLCHRLGDTGEVPEGAHSPIEAALEEPRGVLVGAGTAGRAPATAPKARAVSAPPAILPLTVPWCWVCQGLGEWGTAYTHAHNVQGLLPHTQLQDHKDSHIQPPATPICRSAYAHAHTNIQTHAHVHTQTPTAI